MFTVIIVYSILRLANSNALRIKQ